MPSPSNEREGVEHHIALHIHATKPQVLARDILLLALGQVAQDTAIGDDVGILYHLAENGHSPTIGGATRDRLALATVLIDLARVEVGNSVNEHKAKPPTA